MTCYRAKMIRTTVLKIFLLVFMGLVAFGETSQKIQPKTASQKDPRSWPYVKPHFRDGKKPPEGDYGAYVIIAWANPPVGSDLRGYQIWGDHRIVNQATVTKAIGAILKERPLNVIVIGNDWAAGSELDGALKKLSKLHQVDVLGGSTFGFNNVEFLEEFKEVRTLVSEAVSNAIKAASNQDATGGDPESKPAAKEKIKLKVE